MNQMRNFAGFLGLLALASVAVCPSAGLAAQDTEQQSGNGQPARAVRLSYVDGQVKLTQGSQVLADKAVVNTPLMEGMELTTSDNGKAEIQFEDGSVARIPPDSSLTLTVLRGSGTGADAELTLHSGLAYFELQGGYRNGKIAVHFGDSVVTTSGFAVLRVDMDRPPGQLAVFSGNAHLDSNNGSLEMDLHDGESVALNGVDPNRYDMAESIEPDSWDAWNSDRDQVLTTEAAAQTGAPADMGLSENPAWNDLDANGNWYNVPGQGYVWSPYDAANAGFDPYGNGNWMYTPAYGYIWASGYPWGYLPFQCGAWNFYGGFGWGWAPGLGGCMPWWGMGFYGGPNYGYLPPGYRGVARPILPRRPILGGHPVPMVAVNRSSTFVHGALPARSLNTPVMISGNKLQALQPLSTRSDYKNPTMIVMTGHGSASTASAQTANRQAAGARPGYTRPAGWTPTQGLRSAPANRGANTGFNSAPRGNSGGQVSRPSGGYSGGGAPHASSGGFSGGGGGGGGHPSGGSGGGGGHR